jgi:hypothetical protein
MVVPFVGQAGRMQWPKLNYRHNKLDVNTLLRSTCLPQLLMCPGIEKLLRATGNPSHYVAAFNNRTLKLK